MKEKPKITSFIRNLYDILQEGGHPGTIAWTPDGAKVIVTNMRRLVAEVLPIYFKLQNFESFVR